MGNPNTEMSVVQFEKAEKRRSEIAVVNKLKKLVFLGMKG